MRTVLVGLFLFFLLQSTNGVGADIAAGKAFWDAKLCKMCHGNQGEGGYGPDLAGRGLSPEQFQRAVRKPWGVMPAFVDKQVSDQNLADMAAYFLSLPKVAQPADWRLPPPPAGAPKGQVLLISDGCAQCHGPELRMPRTVLGGEASDVNFQYFSKFIYEHTEKYPDGFMGNFSRIRLPEPVLQDIYHFAVDELGLMPRLNPAILPGLASGPNTTYTLSLKNEGVKGKGLTAEDLTITLNIAPGSSVVSATGAGYQGVQKDPKTNADLAIWKVARVSPEEEQIYTITISGKAGAPADVFKNSVVGWTKPEMRKGAPNLALRDPRLLGKDPQAPVNFPPPPKS
jgi:cytochrome c553